MIGIAILCSLSGLLFGGSIGFILGYKEGENKTREWFEKKLALVGKAANTCHNCGTFGQELLCEGCRGY